MLGYPGPWQEAALASQRMVYLTAAEAVRLAGDLHAVLEPFRPREDDPALRPEGSLPFEVLLFGYPLADPPADGGAGAGADAGASGEGGGTGGGQ